MSSPSAKVRLTVRVSKATDQSVRALLGGRRMKKGELSKFVEQAVEMRLLREMVDDIKRRNAGVDAKDLQLDIDRAVKEVRAGRRLQLERRKTGVRREAVVT